jgi:2-(1,2-epoxy-1,2-dihydrophenyl)acetyl-CoA isomerase
MDEPIISEQREGYRKIILNRPDRLNAFDAGMHQALRSALDAAAADPGCRGLLLTGAGRGFCAGQDLAEAAGLADLGHTLETWYNPLIRQIRTLPLPVVCAVNGIAAGAGANVALACDIVLAARSAKFIQAFVKIGLVPDSGGTYFLPRLVGEARARAMAILGEPVAAEQAEAWGLIWKCVDDDRLLVDAEALVGQLATQPTAAIALLKRGLADSANNDLDDQLALEAELQRQAGRTADYAEGVRAFLEKRAPRFSGGRA